MTTCTICLAEFDPPTSQALGHQACVDGDSIVKLRRDNAALRKRVLNVERELRTLRVGNRPQAI